MLSQATLRIACPSKCAKCGAETKRLFCQPPPATSTNKAAKLMCKANERNEESITLQEKNSCHLHSCDVYHTQLNSFKQHLLTQNLIYHKLNVAKMGLAPFFRACYEAFTSHGLLAVHMYVYSLTSPHQPLPRRFVRLACHCAHNVTWEAIALQR